MSSSHVPRETVELIHWDMLYQPFLQSAFIDDDFAWSVFCTLPGDFNKTAFILRLGLAVFVLVTKLCPTLCKPMGCSPPGYSVHGFQARIQGDFPTLGNLPDPGIEPRFPTLTRGFFTTKPPGKTLRGPSLITLSGNTLPYTKYSVRTSKTKRKE